MDKEHDGYLIPSEFMEYILKSVESNPRSFIDPHYIDPDWDDDEECPCCGR